MRLSKRYCGYPNCEWYKLHIYVNRYKRTLVLREWAAAAAAATTTTRARDNKKINTERHTLKME